MRLVTLKGLEAIAERKFEEQVYKWGRAIEDREGVGPDELKPYLVSLYYEPKWRLEIVFIIPEHTPIKLFSDSKPYSDPPGEAAKLENGKLVGDYDWYADKWHDTRSSSFHRVDDLGHALLLARWAYEEDERAKWA